MNKKKVIKIMKVNLTGFFLIGMTAMVFNYACSSAKYSTGDIKVDYIERSSQYIDGKFRNYEKWEPSFGKMSSSLWDFIFKKGERTPDAVLPKKDVNLSHFNNPDTNQLNVTWLGHSSLMINIDGFKIMTDPVFEKKVSIVGPTRYNGEVPLDIKDVPAVDVVLISHNHYDHLNKFSIQELDGKTGLFIVPLAVGAQLEDWGVSRRKIIELDWWDEHQVNDKLMIAATPAQHFSGRGLTDRDETLWVSFVVKGPNHKIYFSGDSGYFTGFRQIGDQYGPFDMTFIETGAYNEKWHFIHMFPEETVQANIDLRGRVLHPIHWATFNLSLHSWFDPMERLTNAADSLGVLAATPIVGETTIFDEYIPTKKWWEELAASVDE